MASIGYTNQSFVIDGRRIWLVSGAIHYPRVPRDLWRSRLRAAREAGLNCIETYVFWNAHEPEPGVYDFEGQNDLRAFIETIAEEGMWCMLRPGPYVCAEWDVGGLPAWLLKSDAGEKGARIRLREGDPNFLKMCSRYLEEVMRQVADLQITEPTRRDFHRELPSAARPAFGFDGSGGGPIVLMQAENEWMCENPAQEETYLRQLVRYLRENGCQVPIVSCNQLYQPVDGTIHTWNGSEHLAANLRQLRAVQPGMPRLVTEYWTGWFDHWGSEHARGVDATRHEYRLGEILAAGAQFNMYMFHGGTNFGFTGGRTITTEGCYNTTSYDYDAPLQEAGGRGEKYIATKRISTFASHFGHVLAHLEPNTPAALAPGDKQKGVSVTHLAGGQGEVVFLTRSQPKKNEDVELLLPDGLTLPVALGKDAVAWVLRNVNLHGVATLDLTNLRAWAMIDKKLLVLFGPGGSEGLISLSGAPLHVNVPKGQTPTVLRHAELTVAVLNREQVDAAYITGQGLVVGCDGLSDDDKPRPKAGWGTIRTVGLDGEITSRKASATRKPSAPKLTGWTRALCTDYVTGKAPAFRDVAGPASLEDLNQLYGYGWYRLRLPQPAGEATFSFGNSRDRLHVYDSGKLRCLVGNTPGGVEDPFESHLGKELVVLCDHLGRFNFGQRLGEPIGLIDPLMRVERVEMSEPKVVPGKSPDPFQLAGFVSQMHRGESVATESLHWKIKPSTRKPMMLEIRGGDAGVLFVNGEPRALHQGANSAWCTRLLLDPRDEGFTGGQNDVAFHLHGPVPEGFDPRERFRLYQVTALPSEKAQWAFAPWEMPSPDVFNETPKQAAGQPAWYRGSFKVSKADTPLFLEPAGMTKGQIYLNGHNVGRYFVATHTGKAVGPQQRYYLPEPWIRTDGPNELTLFDEHGKLPTKCKLVYDPHGPYGRN